MRPESDRLNPRVQSLGFRVLASGLPEPQSPQAFCPKARSEAVAFSGFPENPIPLLIEGYNLNYRVLIIMI